MIRLRSHLSPNDWTHEHMTRVYVIHPGATSYDLENRISGNLDLPLCDQGVAQVENLKRQLAGVHMCALFHSPNLSAQITAEALGPVLKLRSKCAEDLKNVNLGLWQGLYWAELKERYPKVWRQWLENPCGVCPPQGEMLGLVLGRVQRFLDGMIRRYRDETVGLVVPDPLAQILVSILQGSEKPQLTSTREGGTIVVIDLVCDSRGRLVIPATSLPLS